MFTLENYISVRQSVDSVFLYIYVIMGYVKITDNLLMNSL